MFRLDCSNRSISCALRREQTCYNPTNLQYSVADADASIKFSKSWYFALYEVEALLKVTVTTRHNIQQSLIINNKAALQHSE